jgi:hypothetical protein
MRQSSDIRDDKRSTHRLDPLYLPKHQDVQPLNASHIPSLIIFDKLFETNKEHHTHGSRGSTYPQQPAQLVILEHITRRHAVACRIRLDSRMKITSLLAAFQRSTRRLVLVYDRNAEEVDLPLLVEEFQSASSYGCCFTRSLDVP